MPHPTLRRLLSAASLLAAVAAHAQSAPAPAKRPVAPKTPVAPVAPAAAPKAPATPSGDTHVHRFFQAWGRGMDKAGSALEKVPQPNERWPGTADSRRRSASPSHEGP